MVPHLKKYDFPSPKDALCQVWFEIDPVVFVKVFKACQCIFAIFLLSLLWNWRGPLFEQTWIPITQVCSVLSLVKISPVILEKTIFKVRQCIFAISLLSLLGKERTLHSNKHESPIPKDALCQVWLNLAQWFLISRPKTILLHFLILNVEGYSCGVTHGSNFSTIASPISV